MPNSIRRSIPLGAVLSLLVLVPAASAETLRFLDARSETRATARMTVRSGETSGFRLVRCQREAPRRIACVVRFFDVRREGRTCRVKFTVTVRDANFATRPSIPVCRG